MTNGWDTGDLEWGNETIGDYGGPQSNFGRGWASPGPGPFGGWDGPGYPTRTQAKYANFGAYGGWGQRHHGAVSGTYGPGWGRHYGGLGPTGEGMSDQDVENEVYRILDDDPSIPSTAQITVRSQDHVVTLHGTVRSARVKRAVDHDAWAAAGVNDVHNHLSTGSGKG